MLRVHNASRIRVASAIDSSDDKRPIDPVAKSDSKKKAIKTAKQLGYPSSVLDRILNAETEGEIARIMKTARKEMFDDVV